MRADSVLLNELCLLVPHLRHQFVFVFLIDHLLDLDARPRLILVLHQSNCVNLSFCQGLLLFELLSYVLLVTCAHYCSQLVHGLIEHSK